MKRTPADRSLPAALRSGLPVLGLALAISLTACSIEDNPGAWSPPSTPTGDVAPTTDDAAPTTEEPPAGGELEGTWALETEFLQDAAKATNTREEPPTLTFQADGSLAVDTGCNTGGGSFEVSGDQITLSPIAITLRACEGHTGALEAVVVGLLGAEELSFRIEESQLTLTAEDGTTLAFERATDAAEGDAAATSDRPTRDRPTDTGGPTGDTGGPTGDTASPTGDTATATGPARTGRQAPAPTTTAPGRTTAP